MCGFAGFAGFNENFKDEKYLWGNISKRMAKRLSHRGPDESGTYIGRNSALSHVRLSVMDPLFGKQPMSFKKDGFNFTIVYNGEIYNANELKKELLEKGYSFETKCDTEVVLKAYVEFGEKCAEKLNGIFAFVVDDERDKRLFFCRDRFGVKPLFYTFRDDRIIFASEIKGLFEYPNVRAKLDKNGLCELFAIGPARTPGCGVFKGVFEMKPAHNAVFDKNGFSQKPYYKLKATEVKGSYDESVEKVSNLLLDIGRRQMVADVPVCTFLSGGLDSSVVTALCAKNLKGEMLSTYSFDYEGNSEHFSPTAFEATSDEPFARMVSKHLNTQHTTLICDTDTLYKSLFDAVIAKDLPGMADIDSSLLHFCRQVKENHTVALCGECADEVFGGYPWFVKQNYKGFPWSEDMGFRKSLINEELRNELNLEEYAHERFIKTLSETPLLGDESEKDLHFKKMTHLNIVWFMQTLLDRKDRCSMYSGLEVRVPYSDHRLVEFLYNCPVDYKIRNGHNKSLLRDGSRGLLPAEILFRKKKPYPKTHNPKYEELIKSKFKYILRDSNQPIYKILSKPVLKSMLKEKFDYGKPWFGQLMAGPQLLAYLIQVNYWMIHYNVYLEL